MRTSSDFRDDQKSAGSGAIRLAQLLPAQHSQADLDALTHYAPSSDAFTHDGEERCQTSPWGRGMLPVPFRLPPCGPGAAKTAAELPAGLGCVTCSPALPPAALQEAGIPQGPSFPRY